MLEGLGAAWARDQKGTLKAIGLRTQQVTEGSGEAVTMAYIQ